MVSGYAAGLHAIMRNLALELASIKVDLISPGAVLTPLLDRLPKEQVEAILSMIEKRCATGEVGRLEDGAEAYLYAMRDRSMTGRVISTNEGSLLTSS